MSIEVDLDSKSQNIWSDDKQYLSDVLQYLKESHGLVRHSIIMRDVERGGYLFFLYQKIKPEWLSKW